MSDVIARFEQKNIEGISPSLPHTQGRLFRTGTNVIFHETSVQPVLGQRPLVLKLSNEPVMGLLERETTTGLKEVYWGTEKHLYRYNAAFGVTQQKAGLTGAQHATDLKRPHQWSFVTWSDWVLATNGKDQVQIDKTGSGFTNLNGTNFNWAQILATMGNYILALNTSRGGKLVQWCDADIPEDWTPSGPSSAGEMYLRELESDIVAAAPLGQLLAVYGTDSAMAIAHTGGDFNFARRPLLKGVGALGKLSVCSVGALNFGISARSIWMTDGSSAKNIDDPEIHDLIFNEINQAQMSKVVTWYDKLFDSVAFFYPVYPSLWNNKAVIFNRPTQSWTIWDFGRSAAIESSIYPFGITADENGNIYAQSIVGSSTSADVVPIMVTPEVILTQSYGQGGYGQLGYGGRTALDG